MKAATMAAEYNHFLYTLRWLLCLIAGAELKIFSEIQV